MKEVIGTCHFCGQTRMVRVEENLTQTEEMKQAADLFVLCVKLVSVEKLLENK